MVVFLHRPHSGVSLAVKDWMSVQAQMERKWTVALAFKVF